MGLTKSNVLKGIVNDSNSLLVKHIDRYFTKGNFPPQWNLTIDNYKERDDHYHPSSDCLTSVRDLYLQRTGQGKAERISASTQKAFDCGKLFHAYYDEVLIDMGVVSRENVELVHQQTITTVIGSCIGKGTIDLLNVEVPGHGQWLVDLKTMSGNDIPPNFLEKYIAQVCVYGDWFNTENLMIVGIGKASPHTLREYIIQPDPLLVQEIYDRWTLAQLHIQNGLEPI